MNFGTHDDQLSIKKYIISLLVKQALSDNEFSLIEKKYLAYAGKSLQLSDVDIAVIRRDPDAFEISPPPDESQRLSILYYMLFMMRVDKKITKDEEMLCHNIGVRLGFRKEMVDRLMDVMKTYLVEQLPPNAMIDKVKPYLN